MPIRIKKKKKRIQAKQGMTNVYQKTQLSSCRVGQLQLDLGPTFKGG